MIFLAIALLCLLLSKEWPLLLVVSVAFVTFRVLFFVPGNSMELWAFRAALFAATTGLVWVFRKRQLSYQFSDGFSVLDLVVVTASLLLSLWLFIKLT